MRRSGIKWSVVKIYGLAILLYAIIVAYFIIPALQRVAIADEVKNHLDTILTNGVQPDIKELTGHPAILNIARLNINLSIANGGYSEQTQTWTLDKEHLFVSTFNDPRPVVSTSDKEQPLKVVFYGHNIEKILLNTDSLAVGDILTIKTNEGGTLTYYYTGDKNITPESAGILREARGENPIVLITCDGILNTTRRVMYFAPVNSNNQRSDNKELF